MMPSNPASTPSRYRGMLRNLALVAVAFGLMAWVVSGNREQIRGVIERKPSLVGFAAALGIYLVALIVTFVRWFGLVRALGLPFKVSDAVRLGFIGNLFNLVIPGGVGGDLIKGAFLYREQARRGLAVASMVIDRLLGLLGLFVLASVAGGFAWSGASGGVRVLILIAWAGASGGLVGLAILFSPALYAPLQRRARGRIEIVLNEFVAMARAFRGRLDALGLALGLACVSHGLFVVAFLLIDRSLYAAEAPSVGRHFVIVPLVLLTTAAPIPLGALGLTEKTSEGLFDLVGFPGGAVAMIGFRVVMFAAGGIGALVYLASAREVRSLRRDVGPDDLALSHSDRADTPEPTGRTRD